MESLLQLVEKEWSEWKAAWLGSSRKCKTYLVLPLAVDDPLVSVALVQLLPRQASITRFCDHVVQFHVAERRWMIADQVDGGAGSGTALMACFDAAIGVVLSFAKDVAPNGILLYAQDMVWIASSSAAIWIKKVCGSLQMYTMAFANSFFSTTDLYRGTRT